MEDKTRSSRPLPKQTLRDLFRETQSLDVAKALTEEEIAREVEAMRREQPSKPRGAGAPEDGQRRGSGKRAPFIRTDQPFRNLVGCVSPAPN